MKPNNKYCVFFEQSLNVMVIDQRTQYIWNDSNVKYEKALIPFDKWFLPYFRSIKVTEILEEFECDLS